MNTPVRLCVVGAGPRGTGVLQRLCALAREYLGDRKLEVHVVDPFPAGPGRIWRRDQPELLWMNSPMSTVDMFGGSEGLPSLLSWFRSSGMESLATSDLTREASSTGRRFASRPLSGEYFHWVFERTVSNAAGSVRVHVHRDQAVDLRNQENAQAVWLADKPEPLVVDAVILTQGHIGAAPDKTERDLLSFAESHGLSYRPPGHAEIVPLDELRPGEPVLLRGFGLTFIDQMVLLTQGRGGKFHRTVTGELRYAPSGDEPVLHVGSRRGVPYHSKPASTLRAAPPELPRFFSWESVAALTGPLDFRAQLWPLAAKEILGGYYHELFLGHPERTVVTWDTFSGRFAGLGLAETAELIAEAVPDPADRVDLHSLAEPMAGLRFAGRMELQDWMREYIRADLQRRTDPRHSAELGALAGLSSAIMTTLELVAAGLISPRSRVQDVEQWFLPFGSYLSSGPPGRRLHELIALSAAGVVRFLGPQLRVRAAEGAFIASSPAVPGVVRASTLIEARLVEPKVSTTTEPLLAALFRRGECLEEVLTDLDGSQYSTGRLAVRATDHRLLETSGRAHPHRFAVGPCVAEVRSSHTLSEAAPQFGFFAVNDSLARTVLKDGSWLNDGIC